MLPFRYEPRGTGRAVDKRASDSPRARGTLRLSLLIDGGHRTNPAYAGNTHGRRFLVRALERVEQQQVTSGP